MYFKMEVALDEYWAKRLFELHDKAGGSNISLPDVVEQALQVGIDKLLEEQNG